jgi:signal transduction histidine kinase
VVVLAGAAAYVYAQLRADLNESVDNGLRSRTDDLTALVRQSGADALSSGARRLAEPEESFAQVLTPSGSIAGATTGAARSRPALTPRETGEVSTAGTFFERKVPGIDGTARLLAREVRADGGPYVAVVAVSLEDRDEALGGLVSSFLIGGAVALLAASGIGYLLATAGLAPIEAMRRRAGEVSLARNERLPLPSAQDEVRRLGETLNEMLARLQESFERERRFVADASHELRTPLAVVKAELDTALRRAGGEPELRASLLAASEETDNLAQLAEDLLLIARSADGKLPVRPEPVAIRDLLEQAAERFGDRAREQGRQIGVDVADGLRAELDPLRLRQALGNLVDNALRHGTGDIQLTGRERDGEVEIDVSDEGSGFAPELAPRAFERFARGDAARTRGGAGLGLAIVSAIAEAHDGTAAIAAADGGRTTLRLRFPLLRG